MCRKQEEDGQTPDPDPCARRCVLRSFGDDAFDWWSIFHRVTKPGKVEPTTGLVLGWEIDLQDAMAALELYEMGDRRQGIAMIEWIEWCLRNDKDLPDDFVLFGAPLPRDIEGWEFSVHCNEEDEEE